MRSNAEAKGHGTAEGNSRMGAGVPWTETGEGVGEVASKSSSKGKGHWEASISACRRFGEVMATHAPFPPPEISLVTLSLSWCPVHT